MQNNAENKEFIQEEIKNELDALKPAASTKRRYEITASDLPLSCRPRTMRVWDDHPRVYLPIVEAGGRFTCPYCAAEYILLQ